MKFIITQNSLISLENVKEVNYLTSGSTSKKEKGWISIKYFGNEMTTVEYDSPKDALKAFNEISQVLKSN